MAETGASQALERCEEKLRLARSDDAYAAQYSRAVKALHQRMGVVSKPGYAELVRATDEARELCERACLALEK